MPKVSVIMNCFNGEKYLREAEFLGSIWGVLAVFLMQVGNFVFHGISNIDKGSVIRLVPTLFAVVYFSAVGKSKFSGKRLLLIPTLSILAFNIHPIGRTVWFYSLFWLIPIVVWPFRERFLLLRSLGATFSAHAVGGAIWIWAFNLPAAVWVGLIPVVILERSIFALGISASYILMNNVMGYLGSRRLLPRGVTVNKKYLLRS